jgi:serine/threonine protein kinase
MNDTEYIRYEMKIGEGGFSEVFKIKFYSSDTPFGVTRCLKRIHSRRNLDSIMEFYIMKYIEHFNINYTLKIDIDKYGTINIIQPLALGDCADLFKRKNIKIERQLLLFWLWQIVCALNYLHSKGILHCDVKASNILVFPNNEIDTDYDNCHVRLNDFSLSRLIMNPTLGTYDIKGNYSYTSTHRPPEVWKQLLYSYSADIWALGCTFYEFVYKKSLFVDNKYDDIAISSIEYKLSKIYETDGWNDKENKLINELILGMLELNPNSRLTMKDIMHHECFSDFNKDIPLYFNQTPFIDFVCGDISDNIIKYANKFTYNDNIIQLAMSIYQRIYDKFDKFLFKVCINIASKILYRVSIMNYNTLSIEDEIKICKLLDYKILFL